MRPKEKFTAYRGHRVSLWRLMSSHISLLFDLTYIAFADLEQFRIYKSWYVEYSVLLTSPSSVRVVWLS